VAHQKPSVFAIHDWRDSRKTRQIAETIRNVIFDADAVTIEVRIISPT
jgi:hypothetical protein